MALPPGAGLPYNNRKAGMARNTADGAHAAPPDEADLTDCHDLSLCPARHSYEAKCFPVSHTTGTIYQNLRLRVAEI